MILSTSRLGRTVGLLAMTSLAGCAALPTSGPTTAQIVRAERNDNPIGFQVVDVSAQVVQQINQIESAATPVVEPFVNLDRDGRVDVVGPGDVIAINVFEVGVTLFGGSASLGSDTFDPTARGQSFSGITVGGDGSIRLPFIGRLQVAGKTTSEIEQMIEQGLRSKSQSPQVIVSVRDNVVNTVYVSGAVNRPGRFPLTVARERLLDALAVSGGPSGTADSMVVRFTRNGRSVEARLSDVRTGSPLDLRLLPGDRIELILRPKTFSVFGATAGVALVKFESDRLSLAEAIAKVGGPNDNLADPRGVFLFRYQPTQAGEPVIYRINMMKPANYFLAQNIQMRDKDILYVSNSASNLPTKFINVLNQLFGPLLTARVLTQRR